MSPRHQYGRHRTTRSAHDTRNGLQWPGRHIPPAAVALCTIGTTPVVRMRRLFVTAPANGGLLDDAHNVCVSFPARVQTLRRPPSAPARAGRNRSRRAGGPRSGAKTRAPRNPPPIQRRDMRLCTYLPFCGKNGAMRGHRRPILLKVTATVTRALAAIRNRIRARLGDLYQQANRLSTPAPGSPGRIRAVQPRIPGHHSRQAGGTAGN